ncbi:MAG TPA: ATP-binding protein [Beijerinckiaceae bacterium]|nr:ATP-binding protein [Beijerinckiaceae bacterium]
MRISNKVALVGGIPIAIAAAIAIVAWFLLSEADRARSGAVLAGTAYRDLTTVTRARDDYLSALPSDRAPHAARFDTAAQAAHDRLLALSAVARDPEQRRATEASRDALARYRDQMASLREITHGNDLLVAEMNARAAGLIGLADQARERQHASNADIIASLSERDQKLRRAREIVTRAYELRGTAADAARDGLAVEDARLATARLRNAAEDLASMLGEGEEAASAQELRDLIRPLTAEGADEAGRDVASARLAAWVERQIKLHATDQRAVHEELAELLTYSVQAAETEQATQNIAIQTLKLGRRAADALAGRDADATGRVVDESGALSETMAALPISPLIQSEMIDAMKRWREGLATTGEGLRRQNRLLAAMDRTASDMIGAATAVDAIFTGDADRMGKLVRTILVLGAALGLLVGGGTALVVARSITGPLLELKNRMIELAADPTQRLSFGTRRRDELGSMARAANYFVTEIGRRERALRDAKDEVDRTLAELKRTQADLIQAEKLASLGQLVGGVAHEINTPVGIALTTSTTLDREFRRLEEVARTGKVSRSELTRIAGRLTEGGRLLFANLTRAVDLIYSFKQVAADQASGERRRFRVKEWAHELVTSLGPMLRKSGHEVVIDCPDELTIDTYPGALAQVLTNLIANAVSHAYQPGVAGRLSVRFARRDDGTIRIVFADDGRGIPADLIGRVFDPFFTTGRDRGSTGLGLHIVYNLVTKTLQGRVDVESEPGAGTRFTIELPVTVAEPAPEPERMSA